jgi:hypothetical protein
MLSKTNRQDADRKMAGFERLSLQERQHRSTQTSIKKPLIHVVQPRSGGQSPISVNYKPDSALPLASGVRSELRAEKLLAPVLLPHNDRRFDRHQIPGSRRFVVLVKMLWRRTHYHVQVT